MCLPTRMPICVYMQSGDAWASLSPWLAVAAAKASAASRLQNPPSCSAISPPSLSQYMLITSIARPDDVRPYAVMEAQHEHHSWPAWSLTRGLHV